MAYPRHNRELWSLEEWLRWVKDNSTVDTVTGCWSWKMCKVRGYAQVKHDGKAQTLNRVTFQKSGYDLSSDQHIRHKCDNPPCVNLDHLELGSNRDNVDDRCARGRNRRGTAHGGSKLTEEQVLEVRMIYDTMGDDAPTQRELADRLNCCPATISHIKNRKIWKHLINHVK